MKSATNWQSESKGQSYGNAKHPSNSGLPGKGQGCPLDRFPLATITEQRGLEGEFGWTSGMWTISPYLVMVAASPQLTAYLCNFQELRDSRHPREEFLVNVKSLFALHFLHIKVFLCRDKWQSNHCHILVFLQCLCWILIWIISNNMFKQERMYYE